MRAGSRLRRHPQGAGQPDAAADPCLAQGAGSVFPGPGPSAGLGRLRRPDRRPLRLVAIHGFGPSGDAAEGRPDRAAQGRAMDLL